MKLNEIHLGRVDAGDALGDAWTPAAAALLRRPKQLFSTSCSASAVLPLPGAPVTMTPRQAP